MKNMMKIKMKNIQLIRKYIMRMIKKIKIKMKNIQLIRKNMMKKKKKHKNQDDEYSNFEDFIWKKYIIPSICRIQHESTEESLQETTSMIELINLLNPLFGKSGDVLQEEINFRYVVKFIFNMACTLYHARNLSDCELNEYKCIIDNEKELMLIRKISSNFILEDQSADKSQSESQESDLPVDQESKEGDLLKDEECLIL